MNPLICNFCLGQMKALRTGKVIVYVCEECRKDEEGNLRK